MKINILGRGIEVTEGLRTAIEDKLSKLEKYFVPGTEVYVTLGVEKGSQKMEVTIPVKGSIIRAEEESNDMYATIDLVEETIERLLVKHKSKLVDKKKAYRDFFTTEFIDADYDEEDQAIKIVRTKRFGIKPMDAEEACIQMNMLGHNFFVFLNADTDEVNVVYKRKGNTYGLIEPEFD